MHRSLKSTISTFGLLLILLVTAAGCSEWLAAPFAGSFVTGYLIGYSSATGAATETTTCYRNGVPIDCSALAN